MLTAYCLHRLPADYDTDIVCARAQTRGKRWDDAPDLHFKAFLLRERGKYEATDTVMWRHAQAFREFLTKGHYRNVTDSFGRAGIRSCRIDARKGRAKTARFAYVQETELSADCNVDVLLERQIQCNREQADRADVVAAVDSLDALNRKVARLLLSEFEPDEQTAGMAHWRTMRWTSSSDSPNLQATLILFAHLAGAAHAVSIIVTRSRRSRIGRRFDSRAEKNALTPSASANVPELPRSGPIIGKQPGRNKAGACERPLWSAERRQTSSHLTELAAIFDEPALSVATKTDLLEETVRVDARRRTKEHG